MDSAHLLSLTGALANKRVVVVGDVVADEFVYGSVARVSRLANYAGGLVVMKRGTATVSADELRAAMTSDSGAGPGQRALAASARRGGRTLPGGNARG